jgi:hypothetical protein
LKAGRGHDLGDLGAQLVDHGLGRVGRREHGEPRRGVELGQPASAAVGTSGRLARRALPVTASARSLPDWMCCMYGRRRAEGHVDLGAQQVLQRRARALVRMCVIWMPACCSSIAPVTCCSEPLPDDA